MGCVCSRICVLRASGGVLWAYSSSFELNDVHIVADVKC